MAIQNHLIFQLVPVLLDMVMFHHDDHHVDFVEELVEVKDLVRDNFLFSKERVEALQRTGQMTLLDIEHLQGRALTDIVHVMRSKTNTGWLSLVFIDSSMTLANCG